jgi:pimeloyl-ACP methyl ester carboxylesterase
MEIPRVAAGRLDVGGYRLALAGVGEGEPAVVLAGGLRTPAESWLEVQRAVARFTHVVAYDRAGVGQSERRSGRASLGTLAAELRALLARARIEPPYVLVGHSIGGAVARVFAAEHADDVAGVVLVDATHEGVLAVGAALREGGSSIDLRESLDDLARAASLGDIPLVVLERGRDGSEEWATAQRRLAELSTQTLHVRAHRSGHVIHEDQADAVVAAIRAVVDAARGTPFPACEDTFADLDVACVSTPRA